METLFKERNIQLEEFSSLFAMEGHTGAFGVLAAAVWFGFSAIFFPEVWHVPLVVCATIVAACFFALLWASFFFASQLTEKISHANKLKDPGAKANTWAKLEVQVRRRIMLLSASYVVVCCFLVFLTGGETSPFVPFYIMIFTLTIARNRVPYPGFLILIYFLIAILFACWAARSVPGPISMEDMTTIRESGFHVFMHIIFISASLIVPTASAWFLELSRKEKEVVV